MCSRRNGICKGWIVLDLVDFKINWRVYAIVIGQPSGASSRQGSGVDWLTGRV